MKLNFQVINDNGHDSLMLLRSWDKEDLWIYLPPPPSLSLSLFPTTKRKKKRKKEEERQNVPLDFNKNYLFEKRKRYFLGLKHKMNKCCPLTNCPWNKKYFTSVLFSYARVTWLWTLPTLKVH